MSGGGGTLDYTIKVMDQSEYDLLPTKDPNTIYFLRG